MLNKAMMLASVGNPKSATLKIHYNVIDGTTRGIILRFLPNGVDSCDDWEDLYDGTISGEGTIELEVPLIEKGQSFNDPCYQLQIDWYWVTDYGGGLAFAEENSDSLLKPVVQRHFFIYDKNPYLVIEAEDS